MAYYESEENCWIQRIKVIAFRIIKDLPHNTITRKWVAST